MAQRRFGPTLGAGVAVVEEDGDKILQAAPLGVTAYVGILEKGDVGVLISTGSKKDMFRKVGDLIAASQVPDAAQDFWDHGAGAGELHFVRVTDGTERAAAITLFNRQNPAVAVLSVAAHNGGRWGGKRRLFIGKAATSGSFTATTLTTGTAMLLNEWAGATLTLDGVSGKTYTVVSNDIAGVLTVTANSTMLADLGASPTDLAFSLELPRDTLHEVAIQIADSDVDPVNNFSMAIFVNGKFVNRYADLSMDPASPVYCVNVVNGDLSNYEVSLTDLWSPNAVSPDVRPSNHCAPVLTVTPLNVVLNLLQTTVQSAGGGNPTVALGAHSDKMQYRDRLQLDFTSATAFTVKSLVLGNGATLVGTGAAGTPFVPQCAYLPPFTVTAGATPMASGDKIFLDYRPLEPGMLVGSDLIPDYVGAPLKKFRIVSNDHQSVTVGAGDLTAATAISKRLIISAPKGLDGGYDGSAGVLDVNYTTALNPSTTPLKGLVGQNKGLVKLATPGVVSTTVQKAGMALADSMNWQFRAEIPSNITTEDAAIGYVNNTLGRDDFAVTVFPSYAYVMDLQKPTQQKLVTQTGAIHGREALMAKNYDGYHKAAAGTDVTFPRIVKLPAINLNEEQLNPQGLNVLKSNKGNFIIWGDRSISIDPSWKFKHQRELMSHYENQMRESFDWIVFAINDQAEQPVALTALRTFFQVEFAKRALKGKSLDDACRIKIDGDNNTNLTQANGDLIAEIKLRLADTVERFVIRIGKAGIFEQLS